MAHPSECISRCVPPIPLHVPSLPSPDHSSPSQWTASPQAQPSHCFQVRSHSISSPTFSSYSAEEYLKLLSAQVHPLDTHSAPYNFSPTSFPLLNNAARALHLPALSQKSYLAVFGAPTPASSTMHASRTSSPATSPPAPPLDEKYTGRIIVSGYNISYILPKEFPPRFHAGDSASRISATQMRRPSINERNNMHFMAAIELWTPYASRPPKAPFLVGSAYHLLCAAMTCSLDIYPPSAMPLQQHQITHIPTHHQRVFVLGLTFLRGRRSRSMGISL